MSHPVIQRQEPIPEGAPTTLAGRLKKWTRAMRPIWMVPRDHEGLHRSLIYDMEVAVRILSLPEFAEWLRVHGDETQSRFGGEILQELEWGDQAEAKADAIRQVLVETGALAADDTDTDVPSLLRALLS